MYYGVIDRYLLEKVCTDVFEEVFKDFPLTIDFPLNSIVVGEIDRGTTGSISNLW